MLSHDINTSVQLRLYSTLLSLDILKADKGSFDHRVSSSVRHNIEVGDLQFKDELLCSAPISLIAVIKT